MLSEYILKVDLKVRIQTNKYISSVSQSVTYRKRIRKVISFYKNI